MSKATEAGQNLPKHGLYNVRIFESAQFGQIRTTKSVSHVPLFCLVDVCKSLDIANSRNIVKRLSSRGVHSVDTPTYNQHGAVVMQAMTYIDEPNLYRCIFQSRKAEAELFQDWVCEEVLPAIRQTGGYLATQAEDTPEVIMARALQVAQATIDAHRQRVQALEAETAHQSETIRRLAPKAEYTDLLVYPVIMLPLQC